MKRLLIAVLFCSWFAGLVLVADPAPAPADPPPRPKLVDLGADKCIPCRMMTPVLAELAKEYAGQLDVVFIDVWKTRGEAEHYGIRVIPTQIFYGADGKELFRHEGFYAKKDILAKWKALGVGLTEPSSPNKG
jgi:thioredoxin